MPGAPGKVSVEAVGPAPVASPAPENRPPTTPFPSGRGAGGCSVGSQSRDQYYKAHPSGGAETKGGAGERIPKYFLFLWSRRQLAQSELTTA